MAALRWVADIGSGRVVAVLVGKYPAEHEKLFAKRVLVRGKRAGGGITDEGRSPSYLTADAIQQTAFDAGLGRWKPWHFIRGDHDTAGEISVDEFVRHCGLLKSVRRMGADPSRVSRPTDAAMLVPGRYGPQSRAPFASIEAGRISDRSELRRSIHRERDARRERLWGRTRARAIARG